jgi:hypothetical protein
LGGLLHLATRHILQDPQLIKKAND